jgi:hypothetical protein
MEMITDLRCRLKRSLMKRNDGEIDGVVIMSNDLDKEKGESFSGLRLSLWKLLFHTSMHTMITSKLLGFSK